MGFNVTELTNAWRIRRNRGELRLRRFFPGVLLVDFFFAETVDFDEVCA